jgi:hypothetical protein
MPIAAEQAGGDGGYSGLRVVERKTARPEASAAARDASQEATRLQLVFNVVDQSGTLLSFIGFQALQPSRMCFCLKLGSTYATTVVRE